MSLTVAQLTAEVSITGATESQAQLEAMGAATDVAGAALSTMAKQMADAGLEFFTFDDASKSFVSNMAEAAPVTDATAAALDAVKVAVADTIPSVADLNTQFAGLRERFAQVSAEADIEASAMVRDAEANLRNAEAAKLNTAATEKATTAHKESGHAGLNLMGTLFNLAFAYQLIVKPIADVIAKSFEFDGVMKQTAAVLKSTHDASGMTASGIQKLAESFSHLTTFSKSSIGEMENILLTFPAIGKKIFPEVTQVVLDLSTAMHQSLKQSAIEVGKALDDPARGLTNLRRIGVQFTDAQAAVIKHLVATGHSAEAQRLILKELEKEFGGSAKAAGQTLGGQLQILGHYLQDVGEKIAKLVLPYLTQLVAAVAPVVTGFLDWLASGNNLQNILKTLGDIMKPLVSAIKDIWTQIQPTVQQFADWAQKNDLAGKALAVVKVAVQLFADALRFIVPIIVQVIAAVVQFVAAIVDRMMPIITQVVDFIRTHWTQIAAMTQGIWSQIQGYIEIAWSIIKGIILVALDAMQGNWGQAWKDMQDTFAGVWDGIKKVALGAVRFVLGALALLPGGIGESAKAALKQLDILTNGMSHAGESVKKTAIAMQQAVVANLRAMVAGLNTQLENATSASQRHFIQMKLDAATQSLALQTAVLKAMQGTADGVNKKTGKMADDAAANAEKMRKNWIAKMVQLNDETVGHSIIPDMATKIGTVLSGLAASALTWGQNLVNNFAAGITAGINAAIQAATNVANAVAKILHHSKPEEGPLKDDDVWGLHLAQNFAQGIRAGSGDVRAALTSMFGAAMGNMSVSHSIGGSLGGGSRPMPAFFGGSGGGGSVVINKIYVQPPDMYFDGESFVDKVVGPHLARFTRLQTGSRRPA